MKNDKSAQFPAVGLDEVNDVDAAGDLLTVLVGPIPKSGIISRLGDIGWAVKRLDVLTRRVVDLQYHRPRILASTNIDADLSIRRNVEDVLTYLENFRWRRRGRSPGVNRRTRLSRCGSIRGRGRLGRRSCHCIG